jgi:hypothetical protein
MPRVYTDTVSDEMLQKLSSTIKTNEEINFSFSRILATQFNSFAQTRLNMDTSAKMQWFKDASWASLFTGESIP